MEHSPTDFDTLRRELAIVRKSFLSGDTSQRERMNELAKLIAQQYNERAKTVAKRMGCKPRLITPEKVLLMRPLN
jgi:hypothetical protein